MASDQEKNRVVLSSSADSERDLEVLDVVIVGGGPAGTAAAFRAKELGLKLLVIDYDDLMKRIRDYPKDKLILPDFGGGDRMKFPKGGPLISSLRFSPIDKDEICARWKELYQKSDIPVSIGVELTGLERRPGGIYQVKCYDHGARNNRLILARHLVIAIGRGVPRRFDIPGNTDGVAYRLTDAQAYVGRSACVIGGGTSAAEAVISISNAKIAAQDSTQVFWFYRGDRMPRVSKALADVFFEAYVGNGNIRYYPQSDPTAVVTGEDQVDYLAIRIDRRKIDGRPNETTHLEFPKESCIACIGEDIPEVLLKSLGIQMVTGGSKNKKRMVVTRHLETEQENVYLIGDLLSQAYLETDDFRADPAGFREVKHAGNIKSALRDGVLVLEVIRQKLSGKKVVEVILEDAEGEPQKETELASLTRPVESAGPPKESVEPGRAVPQVDALLVRILPGGTAEAEYPVERSAVTTIGRKGTGIVFPNDTMMSDQHASISHGPDGYFLRDDGSATGTFLRVSEAGRLEVSEGDIVRAGRQFLLFSVSEGVPSVTHYHHTGKEMARYPLKEGTIVLGRAAPDITLDDKDMVLSRRHLSVAVEKGKMFVKDLKSSNGTYFRVRNAVRISHGSQFRAGLQHFVFNLREEAEKESKPRAEAPVLRTSPVAPTKAPAAPESIPPAGGPSVTFKTTGKTFPVKKGESLCDVAEANEQEITAECHAGVCGSDPIRIISGRENLASELGDQEAETLEEICNVSPKECRLACMTKVKGPVEVEILKSRADR